MKAKKRYKVRNWQPRKTNLKPDGWEVIVSFAARHVDAMFDAQTALTKKLRRHSTGSGCNLGAASLTRDLFYENIKLQSSAKALAKEIREAWVKLEPKDCKLLKVQVKRSYI